MYSKFSPKYKGGIFLGVMFAKESTDTQRKSKVDEQQQQVFFPFSSTNQ